VAITSSTGIFSGIETDKIIQQLMSLERRPIENLTKKKGGYETKISSYGNISSLLSNLKNTLSALKKSSFLSLSVNSSDSTVLTATTKSNASEGIYNINVTRIASSQSIYSGTFTSVDEPIADLSEHNTQKIRIEVGSNDPVDISIDQTNNTLSGIRDSINNAKAGVRASIINDGSGYRLVVTSDSTGSSNRIIIKIDENNDGIFEETPSETDLIGLSRLAFNATYNQDGEVIGGITNMTQSQAGLDALLSINGLQIVRPSNMISDAISGVTLNLLNNSSGRIISLKVSKDTSKIINNINAFVTAYKNVLDLAKKSSSDKSSHLQSDSTVRLIVDGIRSSINASYEGKSLTKFGLIHDKYGVASVDASAIEDALENNLEDIINTFDAAVKDIESKINNYINKLISVRQDGLKGTIKAIDSRIDNLERILDKKEMEYRKRFIALEKTIGQLQQSGDFLTRQFSILSKINERR
jgi:flagellar hook-associated protein 2